MERVRDLVGAGDPARTGADALLGFPVPFCKARSSIPRPRGSTPLKRHHIPQRAAVDLILLGIEFKGGDFNHSRLSVCSYTLRRLTERSAFLRPGHQCCSSAPDGNLTWISQGVQRRGGL